MWTSIIVIYELTMAFFYNIKRRFGIKTVKIMKSWIYERKKLENYSNNLRFLRRCRNSRILPGHLINSFNNNNFNFNNKHNKTLKDNIFNLKIRILNLEIKNTIAYIRKQKYLVHNMEQKLYNILDDDTMYLFFDCQNFVLNNYVQKIIKNSIEKFEWIKSKYYNFEKNLKLTKIGLKI